MKTLLGGLPSGNRKLTTTGALIWLGVAYPHSVLDEMDRAASASVVTLLSRFYGSNSVCVSYFRDSDKNGRDHSERNLGYRVSNDALEGLKFALRRTSQDTRVITYFELSDFLSAGDFASMAWS